ncbi:hypothetical protein diail_8876 [Diaporthe ilicicola]|nr:hypothetical protein diail_8876 [Diaporthe ilicicola]
MNRGIFDTSERWRELNVATQGGSPSLAQASQNTLRAFAERLTALYRQTYQESGEHATEAEGPTVGYAPAAGSIGGSQHQQQEWELLSAPSQVTQATEVQMLRDDHSASVTGHGSLDVEPTYGNLSWNARPPFMPEQEFLENTQFQDTLIGHEDAQDPAGPAAGSSSPSRFFDDGYRGPDGYMLWDHLGEDNADEDFPN